MTQLQVARELRWSQSKVNRVENGEVGLSYTDLVALLRLYQVRDESKIEQMVQMAEIARRPSLPGLSEIYSDRAFRRYLELEEIAGRVWQFENAIIPGLLQTKRYAEVTLKIAKRIHELPEDRIRYVLEDIDRKVDFRMSRQEAFFTSIRDGSLEGAFVIDEAVIRRNAGAESGDTSVMAEQLLHLRELSQVAGVDIRVAPFSVGMHAGMSGPFVILDFPDVDDDPLLYVEDALGDFATTEDRSLIRRFSTAFQDLQSQAVRGSDLEALLNDELDRLDRNANRP